MGGILEKRLLMIYRTKGTLFYRVRKVLLPLMLTYAQQPERPGFPPPPRSAMLPNRAR
jgi:hypothetical protein